MGAGVVGGVDVPVVVYQWKHPFVCIFVSSARRQGVPCPRIHSTLCTLYYCSSPSSTVGSIELRCVCVISIFN